MKFLFLAVTILSISYSHAQMNNELLEELLYAQVDSIAGNSGRWEAMYNEVPLIILTDETNDRMRIIAPITEVAKLDQDLLLDCMTANFHSALDVKYAISNGLLWSVFVHPLAALSEEELSSAINQVYAAAVTFGTTFSSTPLLFGGGQTQQPAAKKDSIILKRT